MGRRLSASIFYLVLPVRVLGLNLSASTLSVLLAYQGLVQPSTNICSWWVLPCLWDPAWSSPGQQWPWPPQTMPADNVWSPQLTARACKHVPAVKGAALRKQVHRLENHALSAAEEGGPPSGPSCSCCAPGGQSLLSAPLLLLQTLLMCLAPAGQCFLDQPLHSADDDDEVLLEARLTAIAMLATSHQPILI